MTDQEAEVLTERLTRVWTPEEYIFNVDWEGLHHSTDFEYHAAWSSGLQLDVVFGDTGRDEHEVYELTQRGISLRAEDGQLMSWTDVHYKLRGWQEFEQAFVVEWLYFFRRGCWLSGCPIEASAHEKAEWMQGFSQEELQAWNLKM